MSPRRTQRAIHAAEVDSISNVDGVLDLDVANADEAMLATIETSCTFLAYMPPT